MRAGIAHNDIDPPECGDNTVDQCLHLNRIANIRGETARTIDLRYGAVKLGLLPPGEGKFAALVGKALGNGKAYSARAAGYQRDFVFLTKFHVPLSTEDVTMVAAVNAYGATGHEVCRLGDEKGHQICDFIGCAGASERIGA